MTMWWRFPCFLFVAWCLGVGALAPAVTAAEPAEPPTSGPDWLQNDRVRVELFQSEASHNWQLNCLRRRPPGQEWLPLATAVVVGVSTDQARMAAVRKTYGVYYLFEKCLPQHVTTGVENGVAFLCFRLAREELWLDLKVSLLRNPEFITFACVGKARPDLVPHGSLSLPLTLTGLVADKPGDPFGWQAINAREHRGEYIRVNWARFAGVYRNDHPTVYFFLQAPGTEARHVMFSPGGFGNAWLDYPFAFCATDYTGSREAETLQHLGRRVQNAYRRTN